MVSKIGRYQVLSELGQGGFGKVYLAEDPALASRRVAVKVMTVPNDPALRTRFKIEAVAAASLKHSNVVTILDFGEEAGQPYIVMEFLDGKDLSKVLSKGPPLTLFQKVSVLEQIASGLWAAHSHPSKIIHRDVKPANIVLLNDGGVKITDFGIARLAAESGTRLTSANVVIGSVMYMSPEQFTSGTSDAQTDIWSFGVLAYELLAEQHPFAASDVTQVMYRVTSVEPHALAELVPMCPPDLSAIVARAIHKDRAVRYQSMEDVIFDLNSVRGALRQSEADQILQKAEALYSAGRLEPALDAVREALEVNSQLRTARVLREKLQAEIHRRGNRQKVEERLAAAAQAKQSGDTALLLSHLEAARQMDPSDPVVNAQLAELKAAQERKQEAERACQAGLRLLAAGDLASAERALERAVSLDPDAPLVASLNDKLGAFRQQAQQGEEVRQILVRAEAEHLQGRLDQAAALVREAQKRFPADASLADHARWYAELAKERDAELGRILATLDSYEKAAQWEPARALCAEALRKYPGNAEIEKRQTAIEDAAEGQLNAQRLLIEIRRALSSGELDEAAALAQQAVVRFPRDPQFRSLAAETKAAKARKDNPPPAPATPAAAVQPRVNPERSSRTLEAYVPPAPAVPAKKGLPWMWIAGGVVALLGGAMAFRVWTSGPAQPTPNQPVSFSVSPDRLTFVADEAAPAPAQQIVVVRPALKLNVKAPPFLTAEERPGDGMTQVVVSLRPDLVGTGATNSAILFDVPGGKPYTLPVTIAIRPQKQSKSKTAEKQAPEAVPVATARLQVEPTQIRFAKDLTPRPIQVSTDGPPRDLRISTEEDWIKLDRQTARTGTQILVSVSAERLTPGLHSGVVVIEAVPPGPPAQRVRVLFTVERPAEPRPVPPPVVTAPPVVSETKPPAAPPAPAIVVQQRWRGGPDGELRITRSLQPFEALEINNATPNVGGSNLFPWAYNTRVQVTVKFPAGVTVETQPGPANSWNVIRIQAGAQAVQQVSLEWKIQ